jgi:hypothetical protein
MNSPSGISQVSILLTKHARKRARKRYRWNSCTLERMAIKAFDSGLRRNNTSGYLRKYLDEKFERHDKTKNVTLYGETVFIFVQNRLITVWHLPVHLRPLAKVFRLKLEKSKMAMKANCAFGLLLMRFNEISTFFSEEIRQNVSAIFDCCTIFCA